MTSTTTRRDFMKIIAAAGGGLTVGFLVEGCSTLKGAQAMGGGFHPNAWIHVADDDTVTFFLTPAEMGQGILTSHTQMLAEELEIPLERVKTVFAPADYDAFGVQLTGGSASTTSQWDVIRQAAATTRDLLRSAAATKWGVAVEEVKAKEGHLHHDKMGKLKFGDVATLAADAKLAGDPVLKDAKDWNVVGKSVRRIDGPAKVDGSAQFGIDVQVPNMLTAVVLRPPALRGRVVKFDSEKALAAPGVKHVVAIPQGVAVVADTYWHARKASKLVDVTFDDGAMGAFDTDSLRWRHIAMLKQDGKEVVDNGDVRGALKNAKKTMKAVYELPFVAHATMEPMNATAFVEADRVRVWAPTQAVTIAKETAARMTGLPHSKVEIHATFLGGGFGRRALADFVAEAVAISMQTKTPVKVQWSREDDMHHGQWRPASLSLVEGGIGDDGMPVAWFHRLTSQSLIPGFADMMGAMAPEMVPRPVMDMIGKGVGQLFIDGHLIDPTCVEGASDKPYKVANERIELSLYESGVPVFPWRSVGHSINAFVVESFVDELAHLAGKDPYLYRRALLADAPKNLAVLDAAAKGIGWEDGPKKGRFFGIAQHECFGSYCAHAMEISVEDGLRVHRVVSAIDCGTAVNPDLVAAQMESGVIYGLSAALKQRIDFEGGKVRQSNFHDYPLLRMSESPKIETVIVGKGRPTGVGELGVPPTAPALANAFFAATGVRLRRLPMAPDVETVLKGGKPDEVVL